MIESFSPDSYDVIIVGSGPAGASAALDLAKRGARVLIIEKSSLPRYKTCGAGIVYRAAQSISIDISPAIERECYSAQMNLIDANLHFLTKRSLPIISM